MNRLNRFTLIAMLMCAMPFLAAGCTDGNSNKDDEATASDSPILPSNRVPIPSSVRSNLGITFATVERRPIAKTLRAPGRFEYLPTAIRDYRTSISGRVDLMVDQFDVVKKGDPLYRLDSPDWRALQKSIARAAAEVSEQETILGTYPRLFAAHERHERSLQQAVAIWMGRVERLDQLRETGAASITEYTTAQVALQNTESSLIELQEEDVRLEAGRVETKAKLTAAKATLELEIENAASLTGMDIRSLLAPSSDMPEAPPNWRALELIEVRAAADGIVDTITMTNGGWADAGSQIMSVVQPDRIRFHAFGLQSDLGALKDGLKVMIVPPTPTATGNAVPMDQTMTGTLRLGLAGDANDRTVDLYVTPDQLLAWARPGISGQLEIVTDSSASTELAIPLAAVQRDGLNPIIFRRSPDNPSEAIRMEADLGMDDDRWIAVLSGLREGDEVVLDGGFQLMLATSGSIQQGGHFHADGTYHEGEH